MSRTRTILQEICQRADLETRLGYDGGQDMFLRGAGRRPCAYIAYTRSARPRAGFDDVAVYFGGANPEASRAKVRGMLERSLDVASVEESGGEWPSMTVVARAKKRIYGVMGGTQPQPEPPTPVYENPFTVTAAEFAGGVIFLTRNGNAKIVDLEYSLNGGEWTPWEEVDRVRTLKLQLGDSVRIRNTSEVATKFSFGASNRYQFSTTTDEGGLVKLSGDLRSLLMKANYEDLSPEAGTFHSLFSHNDFITDISELVLAAPVFKANVYNSLFDGTVVSGKAAITGDVAQSSCFAAMFRGAGVNDVTVTVKTNEGGFPDWLAYASAAGVVRCYRELSLPEGSGSGIPEGWTREDLQA